MQIELLKEFITLSVTKNFSEAARQSNVSQPTLSRHMDALESELRCALLNRTRPITLTPSGKRLLSYINDVVLSYDALIDASRSVQHIRYDKIKVQDMSFSPLAHSLLTKCENALITIHPEATFQHVDPKSGKSLFELIENRELDVGFVQSFRYDDEVVSPELPSSIESAPLSITTGNLCFVGRKDNIYLNLSKTPKLSDFENARFLSPTERYLDLFRDTFTRFCERFGGFRPRYEFRETDVHHNFYAENPGQGLFINAHFDDFENPMMPAWLASETKKIIFRECFCMTHAVYLRDCDCAIVRAFVNKILTH